MLKYEIPVITIPFPCSLQYTSTVHSYTQFPRHIMLMLCVCMHVQLWKAQPAEQYICTCIAMYTCFCSLTQVNKL